MNKPTTEFQVDPNTGLVLDIPFIPSPNYEPRPPNTNIDLLVIHNISLPPGEFGTPYINALFTNTLDFNLHPYFQEIKGLTVSCHCFISRKGEVIQYVSFLERAWHAGKSEFEGRENCNDYSIGIELEGTDEIPFTEAQYQTLSQLILAIQRCYPKIAFNRIVGHSSIAPDRKTDPGPCFDWAQLAVLLHHNVASL